MDPLVGTMSDNNNDDDRPFKLRRVTTAALDATTIPSPSTAARRTDDSNQELVVVAKLQGFIRQWSLIPLSAYFESSNVMDSLIQHVTSALECITQCDQYRLLAQLHGLLLHWLDYVVTCHKLRDVTVHDYDELLARVATTARHVCAALDEVYRCSTWNLCSSDAVLILIRALLKLGPHHQQRDTESTVCLEAVTELLHVLECCLDTVDLGSCGLAPCAQLEFLLCLVETCDSVVSARNSPESSRVLATMDVTETTNRSSGAADSAWNILTRLSDASQNLNPNPLSMYAQVASRALSDVSIAMTPRFATSRDLFFAQCLVRRDGYELGPDALRSVPLLLDTILQPGSLDDLTRYQAMDCLVSLARHHTKSSLRESLASKLMVSFLQVLTATDLAWNTVLVRWKAAEGLSSMVTSDESVQMCISFLTSGATRANLKLFVSCMTEAIDGQCGAAHHTPVTEPLTDDDADCWMDATSSNAVIVAACEMLLSVVCMSLSESASNLCDSQLVAMCTSFIQFRPHCEHVVYLTVRTICHEHRAKFIDIVQVYPELVTCLAEVLLGSDVSVSSTKSVLVFLQELIDAKPSVTTVLVRQPKVLEAVTHVASLDADRNDRLEVSGTASNLLFALSTDVCNRRMLARHSRVLSCMIRYVRENPSGTTQSVSEDSMPADVKFHTSCHREAWKERILLLAAVI
jgi:hypothetical protein